ncbi:MtrB/PioB family decaheme-associated outer membrane protein [Rhodoferax sp.]|uniref:MtrB/PioB family decaheme-associated outer membrane protein n=1 Tax=Rhodoferax sp. TaxID=50421 RepID=UPI0028433BC6|nr:MtrB/PioB family decaheme-associated outer membrane protein [Rhodoferax sp.]MDR3368976.1 MtrB/PioB family decaheme-associated outer membrane protein [Rhodoferax sp.]
MIVKTNNHPLATSKLALAIQGALLAMAAIPPLAIAANDDLTALTHPTNSIELGVGGTSEDSAKFGEYTGLDKSGAYGIGNFDIRGGDAYDQDGGTSRWNVEGVDLGTTSRGIRGSVSNQGKWNLGITYDELRHNISNTYQTPLIGSMGGNSFSLPADFGVINTNFKDSVNFKQGAQALTATQLQGFHVQDVHSDRKNTSLTAGYMIDRQWGLRIDYNHLDLSGAKLMSVATDKASGGPLGSTWGGEKIMTIMNPTKSTTDTFTFGATWTGDKAFMTASYFGSFYRDAYNSVTFPNPYASGGTLSNMTTLATFPTNTISTPPSNDFHQLELTGGYDLSSSTKLAGGLSYGRNTQNESYPFAVMQAGGLPTNSLDGLVKTTHADLRLTNQTSRDLTLSAGVKYNKRDNQTASYAYDYLDLGQGLNTSVNIPMSNSKTQFDIAGDYRISSKNRLHLGYEYEGIKRWCNNALANSAQGANPAYVSSSCVQIPQSTENKLVANYKLRANEAVNFNLGYSYAQRNADVNATFYNPMQSPDSLEGYEATGYRAFFDASRKEQVVKTGVNWQANEKLGFDLSARYVDDKYTDSPLGVQNGNAWSTNVDANYAYSENGVLTAYLSVQKRQRDFSNLSGHALTGTNVWSDQLKDEDNALGIAFTQKGLMAGKLEITGDLSYSKGTTVYTNQVPYQAASTCGATTALTCGSTPDITSETITFKLSGIYQLNKVSKVALGYIHKKLNTNDYYYNFYQTGYTGTGNLPTNEQAPSYSVNAVSVSYIYNF